MVPGRFYFWSLLVHFTGVVAVLWLGLHSSRVQGTLAQLAVARTYEAKYQRTLAETNADQLKRMRELLDRVAARERGESEAQTSSDAAATPSKSAESSPVPTLSSPSVSPAPVPTPLPSVAEKDLAQVWRESREDFEALRERYQEKKARTLAELTKTDLETARKEIQAGSKDVLNGAQNAPKDATEAANRIAQMHSDAQGMLNEMLQRSLHQAIGLPLGGGGAALEAYLLGQNQRGAPETRSFDGVVDYTPLMLSRGPRVNSNLDTPEDRRRVETMRSGELRHRFYQTSDQIRFTRRIGGSGAAPAAWIAPDAWYIIGPFPNPLRSQIDTSFPPELGIDRDAVYEGRDGRPISWLYVNTRKVGVIPPDMEDFAVYYAYTEINCAAPIDCWLAIGSDDYSKLWVNGLLVWSGPRNEKTWSATDGFRRVHFEKGVNTLLFRLENGINGCEFSVLIGLE